MSILCERVTSDALKLSPVERAELIEKLFASFNFPGQTKIDELWAAEAEKRIDAFEKGEAGCRPAADVFRRIETGG